MKIGAKYSEDKSEFVVWAPHRKKVSVTLPQENQTLKMDKDDDGYWRLETDKIKPGTRYLFRLDEHLDRPDPASHFQPEGVFGNSALVDHSSFVWKDTDWSGINLKDTIIYELHVGAFTQEGTFAGAMKRAKELSRMGITAVELMPISQFSGARNWGYDMVLPFAVQNTYGGPDQLKKLVQEFHENGIAVILDVIYNHLGPEGNFLKDFGPYFLLNSMTPWGEAINFYGQLSVHVRNFFLENAVHWFKNYHVDGLRLDAVFTMIDNSPKHFLKELSETVEKLSTPTSKKLLLIAENDCIDSKIISEKPDGYGLDAIWYDDFHHAIHASLTGEQNWYYSSFGSLEKVIQVLETNDIGKTCLINEQIQQKAPTSNISSSKLVVFSQNHDQVGNRPLGERLKSISGLEAAKLAAGLSLLLSFTPLLFMGEEYGEDAPFLFFTDYSDETLGKKVRIGRKRELKKNGWKNHPPDPQKTSTFLASKIDWQRRFSEKGKKILAYYQKLIRLRKELSRNFNWSAETKFFNFEDKLLLINQKWLPDSDNVIVANFSGIEIEYYFPCSGEMYLKILDSADTSYDGPGSFLPSETKFGDKHSVRPFSIAFYLKSKGENHD